MSSCFADTSWFLALLGPEDQYHQAAVQLAGQLEPKLITTQFVLLEVINSLSTHRLRPRVGTLLRSLRLDPQATVLPASAEWLERGLKLHLARPDKEWSLTDCISFEAMNEYRLAEALTADHHFEQAGFVALLRP